MTCFWKRSLVLAAGLIAATGARAQEDETRAEALQAELKARAQTIPRESPPAIGVPARETVEGRINWTEMRTELALSARRDAAAQQTVTRVSARPPGLRASAPERYRTVRALEVNRARVPILAPDGDRIAETLKVYAQGDSYSATADVADGVAMRMSGTKRKLVLGDAKSARAKFSALRRQQTTLPSVNAPYLITRSDSATDLSFAKFGAGYVLSLICDEPVSDARCAGDEAIVALASNLVLLNPEAGSE